MESSSNQSISPVRVLLADDHTMFREGLSSLLSSYGGMEVVGEVPNDSDAIELASELNPDVVIMQVQIPLRKAEEAVLELLELSPPTKVVIVTMFEEPSYMRQLLDLGASAYILKSSSAQQLVGTIRAAVFDPKGEHAVVGMPRELLEESEDGSGEYSLQGSSRSCFWPPAGCPTPRSPLHCASPRPP